MNALLPRLPYRMLRWFTRRDAPPAWPAAPSTLAASRLEVCPPEGWASTLSWRGRWQRLVARHDWLQLPSHPRQRLPGVRHAFLDALFDLDDAEAALLRRRVTAAQSLRELWHLRSAVYALVARLDTQTEAERRLQRLNLHFPVRATRGAGDGMVR